MNTRVVQVWSHDDDNQGLGAGSPQTSLNDRRGPLPALASSLGQPTLLGNPWEEPFPDRRFRQGVLGCPWGILSAEAASISTHTQLVTQLPRRRDGLVSGQANEKARGFPDDALLLSCPRMQT